MTGLDYAINRHYDSLQGRFTQVDPIGMRAANLFDPQSLNMYAYCGNDPINHTDPDGLFWGKLFKWLGKGLKWVAIAAMVATAIISVASMVFGVAAVNTFLTTTTLGKVLGFIASIPTRIGSFIAGVGKTIAGVFSFAEAGGVSAVLAGVGYGVLLAGSEAASAIARQLQQSRRGQHKQSQEVYSEERVQFKTQLALLTFQRLDKSLFKTIVANNLSNLPTEIVFCHAAIESGLDPTQTGFQKEIGLFQLKYETANEVAKSLGEGPYSREQLYDPALNTRLATTFLRNLIEAFDGDVRTALGAYKQGPSSVRKRGLSVASQEYADAILGCAGKR